MGKLHAFNIVMREMLAFNIVILLQALRGLCILSFHLNKLKFLEEFCLELNGRCGTKTIFETP